MPAQHGSCINHVRPGNLRWRAGHQTVANSFQACLLHTLADVYVCRCSHSESRDSETRPRILRQCVREMSKGVAHRSQQATAVLADLQRSIAPFRAANRGLGWALEWMPRPSVLPYRFQGRLTRCTWWKANAWFCVLDTCVSFARTISISSQLLPTRRGLQEL